MDSRFTPKFSSGRVCALNHSAIGPAIFYIKWRACPGASGFLCFMTFSIWWSNCIWWTNNCMANEINSHDHCFSISGGLIIFKEGFFFFYIGHLFSSWGNGSLECRQFSKNLQTSYEENPGLLFSSFHQAYSWKSRNDSWPWTQLNTSSNYHVQTNKKWCLITTQVSCITGRFFISWAAREAQEYWSG